jgi:hypothetical protein
MSDVVSQPVSTEAGAVKSPGPLPKPETAPEVVTELEDDGFEMSQAEKAAWYLNSPRHQGDRGDRVLNEFVWCKQSTDHFIDAAEKGTYIHLFADGSALLAHHNDEATAIAFKCAGISDVPMYLSE